MKKTVTGHVSRIVVAYKLVAGVIEFVLGLGFLFYGNNISRIYTHYMVKELLEDPHDLFISIILHNPKNNSRIDPLPYLPYGHLDCVWDSENNRCYCPFLR